jgi:hypothetical protein
VSAEGGNHFWMVVHHEMGLDVYPTGGKLASVVAERLLVAGDNERTQVVLIDFFPAQAEAGPDIDLVPIIDDLTEHLFDQGTESVIEGSD